MTDIMPENNQQFALNINTTMENKIQVPVYFYVGKEALAICILRSWVFGPKPDVDLFKTRQDVLRCAEDCLMTSGAYVWTEVLQRQFGKYYDHPFYGEAERIVEKLFPELL